MKKPVKLIVAITLLSATVLSATSCGAISNLLNKNKETEFYDTVLESKELIDDLADDIYKNWYDAIYNDEFNGDINKAIAEAYDAHEEDLEKIYANDTQITELYKDIRDGKLKSEAKDVMDAYNEYFTVVVECSGSFNDYSEEKEPAKKALASALKDYYVAY